MPWSIRCQRQPIPEHRLHIHSETALRESTDGSPPFLSCRVVNAPTITLCACTCLVCHPCLRPATCDARAPSLADEPVYLTPRPKEESFDFWRLPGDAFVRDP